MITSAFYNLVDKQPEQIGNDQLSDCLKGKGAGTLWVDMTKPAPDEIALLRTVFGVHPLAIDDIEHREQRPKVAEYGDYIFFVLYELDGPPSENTGEKPGRARTGHGPSQEACVLRGAELHLLVGRNFFISIHNGDARTMDDIRHRWEVSPEQQKYGPFYLLYLLLDTVVDDYFPAVDRFDERIEELEDRITMSPDNGKNSDDVTGDRTALNELIGLRHNLIMMRRIVTPLRDAVNVLLRRVESIEDTGEDKSPSSDSGESRAARARMLFAYFQDVYDHAIRIVDTIDTYRDILSGLVDANLAVVSNRTNEIMKVLTSVSIILMSVATITGWYGMNFQHMPELSWRYGYVYVAGVAIVISLMEWRYFRGRRWL